MLFTTSVALLSVAITKVTNTTLLNRVPLIMTHDAGSGYLGKGLVNQWTKTQDGGLKEQLECGARAFDARPAVNSSGALVWHHGGVTVDYAFSQSVRDVVSWCAQNPSELVILAFSDCEGNGCNDALAKELSKANVPTISDCSKIKTMTYGSARSQAKLPGGGLLLAVTGTPQPNGVGCSYGNYHSDVDCSGYKGIKEYSCWEDSASANIPMQKMFSTLQQVNSKGPPSDGLLWQMQAIWQEGAESVVIGTLKNSSLLIDEVKSGLNRKLTESVLNQTWGAINFFEVNNACDHGQGLLAAIKQVYY